MGRIVILVLFCCEVFWIKCYSDEISYRNCQSIDDVIARETQEISNTPTYDHVELAELYVSRGESYVLNAQYEKAIEDFQSANFYFSNFQNINAALIIAFRAAFGEVVSYDNLGLQQHTQHALVHLQTIVDHIVCDDCIGYLPNQESVTESANTLHFSDLIVTCKKKSIKEDQPNGSNQQQDSYEDILGPNQSSPAWCEEVIVGVGRAMDAIACLAPNYGVKIALIGVIETLIARGVKCCQAGGFWKACAAPISRKWQEWKNNKERKIPPNEQNFPLYY